MDLNVRIAVAWAGLSFVTLTCSKALQKLAYHYLIYYWWATLYDVCGRRINTAVHVARNVASNMAIVSNILERGEAAACR